MLRHTPIAGVILTNGEIDAIAGLLSMREGSRFTLYAHARVLSILKANSIFDVLGHKNVSRQPVTIDEAFTPALPDGSRSGIEVLPFAVSGKRALYLDGLPSEGEKTDKGDTLGLRITDIATGQFFYVITACACVTPDLKARLAGAPLVFFDGTVWQDDELIAAGLGRKTGQDMGHIAMAGDHGAINSLADAGIAQKVFLHINNSNPALNPASEQAALAKRGGWQIAEDGMEFTL